MSTILKNTLILLVVTVLVFPLEAVTQDASVQDNQNSYPKREVIDIGQRFFGRASTGLAAVIENAISELGEPNGYIVGRESSLAFIAGIQYGEGELHTREYGVRKVYWQGPTAGFDFGLNGNRVMMLVYNLHSYERILDRYVGINGSAYIAGGFGMTILSNEDIYVVPLRVGLGIRMGINTGYIKFTEDATWNPF